MEKKKNNNNVLRRNNPWIFFFLNNSNDDFYRHETKSKVFINAMKELINWQDNPKFKSLY